MRAALIVAMLLAMPAVSGAQDAPSASVLDGAKKAYDTLMTKTVRLTFEPIAPTGGLTAGVGLKPKDWRREWGLISVNARASYSQNKYWAADGSVAWQSVNGWRIEPYARFRSMKRLNHFGIGNETPQADKADFAMLDRRVGAYGYTRPVGWLAVGGRGEWLSPRTDSGENPDLPTVEARLPGGALTGFQQDTNFVYAGAFVNLNYPYVRSERPRRGGDYMVSVARFHDTSGTDHSFTRVEIEGAERFPVVGTDREFTVHGRLSSDRARGTQSVPFYLMDTLGGADNLRGFKESVIGLDESTATLRSVENFRFRDASTLLLQAQFRQRVWSQLFFTVFADAGMVAPSVGDLGSARVHRGLGVGLALYRANALMIRAEFSVWGGEGHPHYFVPGRGLSF